MNILVVGSVAYDSVRTPQHHLQESLGGSATYFSLAASYFAPVSIVAVLGEDFRREDLAMLQAHGVDTRGLVEEHGKTFRWVAEYGEDYDEARTLETQLNVFADFNPVLSPEARKPTFLFLANIDPDLQQSVLGQLLEPPRLVAGDTMNFWIQGKGDALARVIRCLDILMINEGELRMLTGEVNLVKGARQVLRGGPRMAVVKRGEYGAICFTEGEVFATPAYPLETVVDPTGAGDTFAGGFMGYLAATGDLSIASVRRAMIVGSVMASFAVESFGPARLQALAMSEIQERYRDFWRLTYFDGTGDWTLPRRTEGIIATPSPPSPSVVGKG